MKEHASQNAIDDREPLERLAEEFLQELRAGESPSWDQYASRHPDLAAQIKELFPTLVELEAFGCHVGEGGAEESTSKLLVPPKTLGDYEITRQIGQGGMGVVYEAVHRVLQRKVALKILPHRSHYDPHYLERFKREAQAIAVLHHTNIVPIFEVGESNGVHFIALQLIDGISLDRAVRHPSWILNTREIPREEIVNPSGDSKPDQKTTENARKGSTAPSRSPATKATSPSAESRKSNDPSRDHGNSISELPVAYYRKVGEIGFQIASALAYVHQHKCVHRDIKPSNILLDRAGVAWISDFGLAKSETFESDLTQSGGIVGTIRYLPPERLHGESNELGDIYSLGMSLYELACGRPGYEDTDRLVLMQRIANEDPVPLHKVNSKIPRDLQTIISKCVNRNPGRRYESAESLSDDLYRWLHHEPIAARRSNWLHSVVRWVERKPLAASLLAVVLVMACVCVPLTTWKWIEADNAYKEASRNLGIAEEARSQAEASENVAIEERTIADEERLAAELAADELQNVIFLFFQDVATSAELLRENPSTQYLRNLLLDRAEKFYTDYLTDNTQRLNLGLAQAYTNLGGLQIEREKWEEGEETLSLAQQALMSLPPNTLPETERLHLLSHCYANRAKALQHKEQREDAKVLLEDAIAIARRLHDGDPESVEYYLDLSFYLRLSAEMALADREIDRALSLQSRSVEFLEQLIVRRPTVDSQARLSNGHLRLARIQQNAKSFEKAEQSFSEAVRIRHEIKDQYPLFLPNDFKLVTALYERGVNRGYLLSMEDSLADFEAAYALARLINQHYPRVVESREQLVDTLYQRGKTLGLMGQVSSGIRDLQTAQSELKKLIDEFGMTRDYSFLEVRISRGLGDAFYMATRDEQSLSFLDQTGSALEFLETNTPSDPLVLFERSQLHLSRARTLRRLQRKEECRDELEGAIAIFQALLDVDPSNINYRHGFASTMNNLGLLNFQAKEFVSAMTCFESAVEGFRSLHLEFPTNKNYLNQLAQLFNNQGSCSLNQGELDDAINRLQDSIAYREKLIEQSPENATYRTHFYGSHVNIAVIDIRREQNDEAVERLEFSQNGLETLLEQVPEHTTASNFLEICEHQLANALRARAWAILQSDSPSDDGLRSALEDAQRAHKVDQRTTWESYRCLAEALWFNHQNQRAIEMLDKALENCPDDARPALEQRRVEFTKCV